jgi:uncharacterized membrane protein YkvI
MNSVGSHGSLSLPFVMKVMVCHFVSDSHEVMTALIVVLPLIIVVEISLQLHRSIDKVQEETVKQSGKPSSSSLPTCLSFFIGCNSITSALVFGYKNQKSLTLCLQNLVFYKF